jgi:hypothetical protein
MKKIIATSKTKSTNFVDNLKFQFVKKHHLYYHNLNEEGFQYGLHQCFHFDEVEHDQSLDIELDLELY